MKYILTKKAMLRLGDILVLKYKERIEADQTIAA